MENTGKDISTYLLHPLNKLRISGKVIDPVKVPDDQKPLLLKSKILFRFDA
jgi:hypothetical protein